MKFKENVQKILQKLGFAGSEESLKALTPDEWKQFFASYHEEFGTDFHTDMQATRMNSVPFPTRHRSMRRSAYCQD